MSSEFDQLFSGLYWHQRWEIAPGIYTPGHNDIGLLMKIAGVPADLTGKRVLDIGAWNGCVSFECERRGASEVLAIGPESAEATGFDRLARHLGSKVRYQFGTVYHLLPEEIGTFDVVICFGVMYHLRHPLLALDMIRRVCRGTLYLESSCIDRDVKLAGGVSKHLARLNKALTNVALLQFYRRNQLNNDDSNWFSFNKAALEDMLLSSGFEPARTELVNDRIVVRAPVIPGRPEWMTIGSGEGVYYDVITRPLLGSPDVY